MVTNADKPEEAGKEEDCRGIEFNVFISNYMKQIHDPYYKTLRKYLEYGAKTYGTTPNDFLIKMIKRAILRNIMGISKKRMNQQ